MFTFLIIIFIFLLVAQLSYLLNNASISSHLNCWIEISSKTWDSISNLELIFNSSRLDLTVCGIVEDDEIKKSQRKNNNFKSAIAAPLPLCIITLLVSPQLKTKFILSTINNNSVSPCCWLDFDSKFKIPLCVWLIEFILVSCLFSSSPARIVNVDCGYIINPSTPRYIIHQNNIFFIISFILCCLPRCDVLTVIGRRYESRAQSEVGTRDRIRSLIIFFHLAHSISAISQFSLWEQARMRI